MGTHAARFIKQAHPDSNIVFCIRENFELTTTKIIGQGVMETLDILSLQEGIDDVGIVLADGRVMSRKNSIQNGIYKVYNQHGWYADLGIVKSALVDIAEEIGWNNVNTETNFSVGEQLDKRPVFSVVTAGPLDWDRKLGQNIDLAKVFGYLRHLIPEATIIPLGRDINQQTYLEALKTLSTCHLYIGPMGSMTAAAAGLGVDTINVCSVFPPSFDSPEFYHSGNHHSVTAKNDKHCITYKCIKAAYYKKDEIKINNPEVENHFWTQTCKYMPDNKSCVANITAEDIIEKIDLWFARSNLKNR